MRTIIALAASFALTLTAGAIASSPRPVQPEPKSAMPVTPYVLKHEMKRIDGTAESLEKYKGKVVLMVNTASRCGLTPQYEALEKLYRDYKDKGLVVLGFPANNFMNQEPGSNKEIQAFCTERFDVTFPMFEKISVKGEDAHPLYKQLAAQPDPDVLPSHRLLETAVETGDIAGTLRALNPVSPDYARLKGELARTSDPAKRKLIRANMDRWRWLARDLGKQYLLANVPEYQLRLTVNDKIIKHYRVVVGKPGRTATPQLSEMVEAVIFNPTWTVPQSIVKGEGLGAKVLNNPGWARANNYTATKGANGWITVVQQPGPGNSLGLMKLDMPNPHAIFFHDTPAKSLFARDVRALSHGCIRVQGARELAMTMAMLGNAESREDLPAIQQEVSEITASGKYTRYPMEKQWPAYITYFTYGVDVNGELRQFDDIYGRDAPVLAALDAPRQDDRARETSEEAVEIVDDLQTS